MNFLIFLKEHWVVLSGLGAVLFASVTIVFNVVYRYKEIPSLKEKIEALEDTKDETCRVHNGCFVDLQEDIKKLDTKICKNIGEVNATLTLMEERREKAKDKLHDELILIHDTLGEMKGKMHVSG